MSVPGIDTIVERLQHSANVRNVYGDPIERGDRTVVPVARVTYGFGGGFGRGPDEERSRRTRTSATESESVGEGGGIGGGASATPVGALEITDGETRFVRFDRGRTFGLLAAAFAAGVLVGRGRRK
ncbi:MULTISPECIES: GerW family sporulation protein [Halorussus]|uniref:GerW family sporulation protein n=1 Tax=Halorussus TaxID=1070314 RepID=UPI0020A12033|nr:spore germination protein GerW family protein [Halorussus vallis]USZ77866.1 spore germination protein GerW family protein [Halorussus vallis]